MLFEANRTRAAVKRVKPPRTLPLIAREGIPLRNYAWLKLVPGVMLGAPAWLYLKAVAWTSREIVFHHPARIPSNAILFLYEGDRFLAYSAPRFWQAVERGLSWLGEHGFRSYFSSFGGWHSGFACCRVDHRISRRPVEQVLDYLRFRRLGRFALRADTEGPRGRIGAGIVDLSLGTRRPVVAIRQRCDRSIRIRGRAIPLPFCTVATTISEAVYPEDFAGMPREHAQARLQRLMDCI